jgi:hypothetical protein
MRTAVLGVAALCASVVFAVPHGEFQERHTMHKDLHGMEQAFTIMDTLHALRAVP